MALEAKQLGETPFARPVETWVWPLTAAIVVGGSILFWSLVGLFWIATHPAEKAVVIWMAPAEAASVAEQSVESTLSVAAAGVRDDQAN
jgi:hypothetical protein